MAPDDEGTSEPAIAAGVFTMLVSSALLALGEDAEPPAATQVIGSWCSREKTRDELRYDLQLR
jgi:hypothetical protein